MRILFVSSTPCFPPINGETIPSAAHMNALKKRHEVDFLFLKRDDMPYSDSRIEATKAECARFFVWPIHRHGFLRALYGEVVKRVPYYGAFDPGPAPDGLPARKYDLVWCTNWAPVSFMGNPEVRRQIGARYYVAGLSDMHSLVARNNFLYGGKCTTWRYPYVTKSLLWYPRSLTLSRCESRLLRDYDLITMQSDKELEWVRHIAGADMQTRCLILPNGVNEKLLELPLQRTSKTLVFAGLLDATHRERMIWFFTRHWPRILERHPDAKATVVGRPECPRLNRLLTKYGATYLEAVPESSDLYANNAVFLAPIYKRFGVINRVLEAMAAGSLVVGDDAAFNGLTGFVPGTHGLLAETPDQYTELVCQCFDSPDLMLGARTRARELIRDKFMWASRESVILDRVEQLVNQAPVHAG